MSFQALVVSLIAADAVDWKCGNNKMNVANQFDESILESALEIAMKLLPDQWESVAKRLGVDLDDPDTYTKRFTPIDLATTINNMFDGFKGWEDGGIARAWVD